MRTQLQRFGAVVALAFAISGCWDGAIRARVTPTTITVIDGYISGAVVCVDKNNNASCDDDETIRGTTDADGKVTLDVPEDEVGKYPIVAYVPIGATDAVTGKVTQAFTLRAPAASPNTVTPYTTMVQSLIDEGYSFEEAFKSVAQKTGITEPTSDFTSNHKSSTLARTMVALQINRLHALENLSSCKASQSDKEKKISSAIHSRVDNISATSDLITTCTNPVDQKTTTCQASIDNAVTSIVAANPALSTVSIQNSLSDTNCHKPPEQTAIIRGANSGGMSIGNDGRTEILDVTLIGEYTGETLGTEYSVQVMDNNVTAGVADKEDSNKSWRLNLRNQAPGKHSYKAVVVRKSDSLQGAASSAFTVNVGNSVAFSSNSPNVWDEFTLTLSHVWSSIQSVVFNFATDAAELADLTLSKTANLVGNVWDSVTTAFKTVGSKTIIAQFFDGTNGTGKALETNRLNLTVGPANVTLTANIIDVWDGSSRITEVSGQTTTSNTKPTISGTVSSVLGQYYVVKLFDNDVLLPGNMAYNTARTNWTFTPAAALSGGLYKLTAKVSTFDGGATGTASAIKSLVIRLPINDTGITADQCYGSDSDEFFRCTSSVAIGLSSQQDGMIGRDVSNNDDRDGKLGFSFREGLNNHRQSIRF